MAIVVRTTNDPGAVLEQAGGFLSGRPVEHNMVHTSLREAARSGSASGRFWVVASGGEVVGVAVQAAPGDELRLTPMSSGAARALGDAVADEPVAVTSVSGEVATVGVFVGRWTERCDTAARPIEGERIYEVRIVSRPAGVGGVFRPAEPADRDLVVSWLDGMQVEIGEPLRDNGPVVDRRLLAGHFWIWDDTGAVSMAALTEPAAGAVRVQAVYTPPEHRGRGYAAACVAATSQVALSRGQRCLLYTDLGNRSSNAIYRRIGFRAVSEILRYALG